MMDKAAVIARIKEVGVIPVVRTPSADEAIRAVEAIRAGGITVAEITMTVPAAIRVIEQLVRRFGNQVLVGAGTVLDSEVAHDCVGAGACFVVSPVLHADTIAFCTMRNIAVMPGALTPTEVVQAATLGADLIKIFPAAAMGGPSYIRALRGPLPELELVPSGGVTLENAAGFIEAGASAIGVGGDLVDVEAIRSGHPEKLTRAARAYLEAVHSARRGAEIISRCKTR